LSVEEPVYPTVLQRQWHAVGMLAVYNGEGKIAPHNMQFIVQFE
jgi:hypothetical protein